jgi:hypothetical protein
MRWQKARSFLSAYCNDELSNRRKLKVSRLLQTSKALQREEQDYRAMQESLKQLPSVGVSDDFNNKLLNRVAQERFKETRTKAYLPKAVPLFRWSRAIPALVSVSAAVLLAFVTFSGPQSSIDNAGLVVNSSGGYDAYLTAQPTNNPNVAVPLAKNWSLNQQMASMERVRRLSESMRPTPGGFNFDNAMNHLAGARSLANQPIPYVPNYYKVRPVLKLYISPQSTAGKEVRQGY